MQIALVSAFLEDDVYQHPLDDNFMTDVICQEDHFYHRIAKSLVLKNCEPVVFYMSKEKHRKEFRHKYGHKIVRIPVKRIPFFHEPIVFSNKLIYEIKNNYELCFIISGYYVMYKIPDMFDYIVFKLNGKIPIIARWAGGDHKWLLPLRKNIKKNALNKCNKIICSGKQERKILKDIFCIQNSKISEIVNPVNLSLFKKRSKHEIYKKLGLDSKMKYFLYVGRLIHNKGIEELLIAFKDLVNQEKNIFLIIIGEGPLYDFIKTFVNEHNLQEKVMIKGRLQHEQLCYYYNIGSILFHIGISGGMPNAILEAISSGLPIIASDNGANKDLVNEKLKTGIIIEPNNESQLRDAIKRIISGGFEICETPPDFIDKFSFETYGDNIIQMYNEIRFE